MYRWLSFNILLSGCINLYSLSDIKSPCSVSKKTWLAIHKNTLNEVWLDLRIYFFRQNSFYNVVSIIKNPSASGYRCYPQKTIFCFGDRLDIVVLF